MPRKSVWVPPKSYVISVSLGTGCYRHIKIDADSALSQLSSAILDAFETTAPGARTRKPAIGAMGMMG